MTLTEVREKISWLTNKLDDFRLMIAEAAESGNFDEVQKLGPQRFGSFFLL